MMCLKKCQFCKQDILDDAIVCNHCANDQIYEDDRKYWIRYLSHIEYPNKHLILLGVLLLATTIIVKDLKLILLFITIILSVLFLRNNMERKLSKFTLSKLANLVRITVKMEAVYWKPDFRTNIFISITVIIGILMIMSSTNPNKEKLNEYIKNKYTTDYEEVEIISSTNYVIVTKYKIKYKDEKIILYGLFNNFSK